MGVKSRLFMCEIGDACSIEPWVVSDTVVLRNQVRSVRVTGFRPSVSGDYTRVRMELGVMS